MKLPFGHHGANHPVKDLTTGKIEITSQNHNFAVDVDSLAYGAPTLTHVNLNDGVCEGLAGRDAERVLRCSTTPRRAPDRTTARTCSNDSSARWRRPRSARRSPAAARSWYEPTASPRRDWGWRDAES